MLHLHQGILCGQAEEHQLTSAWTPVAIRPYEICNQTDCGLLQVDVSLGTGSVQLTIRKQNILLILLVNLEVSSPADTFGFI